MEISPEQKRQFLDLAIARGYLTQEIVDQWSFLALDEFLHSGYLTKENYCELWAEVMGEDPHLEEATATDISDKGSSELGAAHPPGRGPIWQARIKFTDLDASDVPAQRTAGLGAAQPAGPNPVWQTRMKFTGLDIPVNAVAPNKEPPAPTPMKLSVKALKERREQLKKAPTRSDKQQGLKPPETPETPADDYDPEQEATDRVEWYRILHRQLHQRTVLELARHLRYTVAVCGATLVLLNLFYLCSLLHLFLCAALGSASGYSLHRSRGEGGVLIFTLAFVSSILAGEVLGAQIFDNILSSIAGAVSFALLAGAFLLYLCLGRALGDAIRSNYFNYY